MDLPAIRKPFIIVKSEKSKEVNKVDKLIEIFKDLNGLEEISEKQMEVFKALSEEDIKKYSGALEILKKYKDELPEDLNKELSILAKFGVREVEKTEDKNVEKAGKKLSKDTLNVIEHAVKQLDGLADVISSLSNLLPTEDTKKMAAEKAEKEKAENQVNEAVKKTQDEAKEEMEKKDKAIKDLEEKVGKLEVEKGDKQSLEEESSDGSSKENKHIQKDGSFEWTFMNQE